MFENEAEEYADEQFGCGDGYYEWTDVKQGFQDGAEFGYNKCKKELNQKGLALQSDMDKTIEQNIALKKELENANEWHYVKDEDYPKDNKPVLCILGDIDLDNCEVGYYNDVGSGEPWHFETYHLPDDDGDNAWGVSAWKEIVLPKESE